MAWLPRHSAKMFAGMACAMLAGLVGGIGLAALVGWPEGPGARLVGGVVLMAAVAFPAGMPLERRLLSRPAARAPLDFLSRFGLIGVAAMSRARDPLLCRADLLFPTAWTLAAALGVAAACLLGLL